MSHISSQQIKQFQEKILSWYAENQRKLPWRHTRDPYRILISEVMSQQTQLSRVIPKYEAWIHVLPTVNDLANASTAEVLGLWSGLGYNRRALYLQKTAQEIVAKFNGYFPENEKVLQTLPGIGDYTAKAVVCFAFDKQIAVVDTNVKKIILTQFQISLMSTDRKDFQSIADQLLPIGKAYEWNQALMDYSASVLKKEKIPQVRQSTFKNSDRYFRGQIIKLLLQQKHMSHGALHDYFNKEEKRITKERLEKIITSLEKDALIKENAQSIELT